MDLHVSLQPVQEHVGKAAFVTLVARLCRAPFLLRSVDIQAVTLQGQWIHETLAAYLHITSGVVNCKNMFLLYITIQAFNFFIVVQNVNP